MKSHLNSFAQDYLRVVLGTLFAVAFVAFLSLPYTLGIGTHAEEAPVQVEATLRHLT